MQKSRHQTVLFLLKFRKAKAENVPVFLSRADFVVTWIFIMGNQRLVPTTLSSITADVCIQSIPLLCKMIISAILDDPGLHQIGNITII